MFKRERVLLILYAAMGISVAAYCRSVLLLALVLVATVILYVAFTRSRKRHALLKLQKPPTGLMVLFVSICVGSQVIMLGGFIMLPVFGIDGFQYIFSRWFPAILIAATVVSYPFVKLSYQEGVPTPPTI